MLDNFLIITFLLIIFDQVILFFTTKQRVTYALLTANAFFAGLAPVAMDKVFCYFCHVIITLACS